MKIKSLQSVGLGTFEQDPTTGNLTPAFISLKIGECFIQNSYGPSDSNESKIISIDLVSGDSLFRLGLHGRVNNYENITNMYSELYYKILTEDGHIRVLPEHDYIAEWVQEDDHEGEN